MSTTVYQSPALVGGRGTPVTLRLLVAHAGPDSEIWIEREERLPHKTLSAVVLKVRHSTAGVEQLARHMTAITHELERLHVQGHSLRQRAGGGWRGAWRFDLVSSDGSHVDISWEIELRRPSKQLAALAQSLSVLDLPTPSVDQAVHKGGDLAGLMREQGDEIRRRHAIEALNASDPTLPANAFLDELDARGLLAPRESELSDD